MVEPRRGVPEPLNRARKIACEPFYEVELFCEHVPKRYFSSLLTLNNTQQPYTAQNKIPLGEHAS